MMRAVTKALRRYRWVMPASIVFLQVLAACSRPAPWALQDVSGMLPQLEFDLTNDAGQRVNASDYRGKVVLLYFGYTHCPDVCPMVLGTLSRAVRKLGKEADKVRVLFVTVDPQRDTMAVLKEYVNTFGPQFVGLRDGDDELESLVKRYHVSYSRDKADAEGKYAVIHSSTVFIFDGEGQSRLLAVRTSKTDDITRDLQRLIASN